MAWGAMPGSHFMRREVGGEYDLPISWLCRKKLGQLNEFVSRRSHVFTASGRDSLKLIIRVLGLTGDDEIMLPSYLCEAVLRPFKEEKVKFVFYRVNENLKIDITDIENKITHKTRALLVIHYFGYPQHLEQIQQLCGRHSIYLIEDLAQSFLTRRGGQFLGDAGDVSFNSFRKFLPVLDGSLLIINNKNIGFIPSWERSSLNHFIYICCRLFGMKFKSIYLETRLFPKVMFLRLFIIADEFLNKYRKPARISFISKSILGRLDFEETILKRRRNFQYLLDNWHVDMFQPLFVDLPDGVCPLGFPILVENRDHVRNELIRRRIYPPVHWNLPVEIDKEEFDIPWKISQSILTIPVDQRYELNDMDYVLENIQDVARHRQVS